MIKPTHDFLLIEPEEKDIRSAGGLVIDSDINESGVMTGIVTEVGPGRMNDEGLFLPLCANVGDKVFYTKFGGTKFGVDGKMMILLRDKDIMAVERA